MKRVSLGSTDLRVTRVALGGIPIMRVSKEEGVRVVQEEYSWKILLYLTVRVGVSL